MMLSASCGEQIGHRIFVNARRESFISCPVCRLFFDPRFHARPGIDPEDYFPEFPPGGIYALNCEIRRSKLVPDMPRWIRVTRTRNPDDGIAWPTPTFTSMQETNMEQQLADD